MPTMNVQSVTKGTIEPGAVQTWEWQFRSEINPDVQPMPFTSDLFYLDVVPSLQFGGEVGPAQLTITDQVRVISATPTDPGNNMQTYTLKIGCVFKNTGTVAANFHVNLVTISP